jgi:hypothetical protein
MALLKSGLPAPLSRPNSVNWLTHSTSYPRYRGSGRQGEARARDSATVRETRIRPGQSPWQHNPRSGVGSITAAAIGSR